jgi:hypothetical protein
LYYTKFLQSHPAKRGYIKQHETKVFFMTFPALAPLTRNIATSRVFLIFFKDTAMRSLRFSSLVLSYIVVALCGIVHFQTRGFAQNTPGAAPPGRPIVLPEIRFVSVPSPLAMEGREYRYEAKAQARDTTARIVYRLVTAPNGMTIDAASGAITWIAALPASGSTVRVSVEAALANSPAVAVTQTFGIHILTSQESEPSMRFLSAPPPAALVGVPYTYHAVAFYGVHPLLGRPRLGNVQYSLIGAPAGMTIESSSGVVRWTPEASGTVRFAIQAISTTVASASATQDVEIRVGEARPVFTSRPPAEAFVGQEYLYQAIATILLPRPTPQAQRDQMTYALAEAPEGMTVEASTGLVRWTPRSAEPSIVRVVLRATPVNSPSATTTQEFRIEVKRATMTFMSRPPLEAAVGRPYRYQPVVSYGALVSAPPKPMPPGGDSVLIPAQRPSPFRFRLSAAPAGMSINAEYGTITWTPSAPDTVDIAIVASLASDASISAEQSYRLRVVAANANPVYPKPLPNAAPAIRVAPNPVRGQAQFYLPNFAGEGKLSILNLLGEEIWSASVRTENSPISWQAGTTQPGVYVVRLVAEGLRAEAKFIVAP